jgi:N-acylneuraminate cytidylyltransferase
MSSNLKQVLAIIPARGGSKGIPRKNIRPFSGYPLVAWSIAAARQCAAVTRTLVSTDDEQIAAIARQYGAEVPFLRPPELAQDQTTDLPVFVHALQWLAENQGYQPDVVVQLRPTSPIRPRACVAQAVQILGEHSEADCVRAVVPAGQNPYKMWRLDPHSGRMLPLLSVSGIPEPYNAPRQVLPQIYWQTGHIDAIRPATILEKRSMTGEVLLPLILDPRYTVDLDTPNDWAKAEWLVNLGGLDCIFPGRSRRAMPREIDLLVLDFDGVLTDNRVWTDQDGREMVAAYRSDSAILGRLKAAGVEVLILSTETNPVVSARARKMGIEAVQGVGFASKGEALQQLLDRRGLDARRVVYAGNDINDLPCFDLVGWGVAVADAQPEVLHAADLILSRPGGRGAVRELCDIILTGKEVSK